jgi:hypothetical protein
MDITKLMGGKYLKKEDVMPDLLLTITDVREENVAPADKPEDRKGVMYFEETEKGLVMNNTNLQLVAIAIGSKDTDDWAGHKIVAYNDPTVGYAGKITGGIRLRPPRNAKKPTSPRMVATADARPEPPEDDDIPL